MKEDKEQKPEDKVWAKRLHRMKAMRERYAKSWSRNKALMFGDSNNEFESQGGTQNNKAGTVSFAWGLAKALEAHIFVQNPSGVVDPYDMAKLETARLLGQVMRFDMDQMNWRDIVALGFTDNFIAGFMAMIEKVENLKESVKTGEGEDDIGDLLRGQRFCAERIHPKDILFAPTASKVDLSDCPYLAIACYPTIQSLMDDPLFADNLPEGIENFPEYSPGSRDDLKQDTSMQIDGNRGTGAIETDPAYKQICMWEIHNKVSHELVYVLDHGYAVIGRAPWPTQLQVGSRDLFPVTLFAMHPDTAVIYPKPEMDPVAPQLVALNRLDALILDDAQTKIGKYVAPASLVSNEKLAEFTDNPRNNFMTIEDTDLDEFINENDKPALDLRKLIVPLEDVAPKRDLFAVREMVINEIEQILGYGPLDRGGMPKTRSAREAVAIKEQLGARMEPRKAALDRFFQDAGQKHLMMLQQHMKIERYARIFEGSGQMLQQFVAYAPKDIEGNFCYRVLPNTSTPQTGEARQAMELQLFQTLAPIIVQTGGDIRIAVKRLALYFQWDGIDALFAGHNQALISLLQVLQQFGTQPVNPQDFLRAATAVIMTGLSPDQIKAFGRQQGSAPPQQKSSRELGPMPGPRGDQNPLGTASGTM